MADVSADIKDWSVTAGSNSPADATTVGAGLADNFQQIQATVRAAFSHKGSDIVSAGTMDLGAVTGFYHDITGSTGPITTFGTVSAGVWKIIQFDSTPTITYNATSMILPGNVDYTAAAGDHLMALSLGSGNWVIPWIAKDAPGSAPPFSDAVGIIRGSADATKILRVEVDGFTTGTTRVLTPPNQDLTIAATLTKAIHGWTYANGTDATNDIDFAAGGGMDSTGVFWITGAAMAGKQLDVNWAPGAAAGMRNSGAAIANTNYYLYAVAKADGTQDYYAHTSTTVATVITALQAETGGASYLYAKLIGFIERSGGSITAFTTYETEGGGLNLLWSFPSLDISLAATLTTSRRTDAVKVPLNFSVIAHLSVLCFDASAVSYTNICCPDEGDAAVDGSAAPLANAGGTANVTVFSAMSVRTSATGTIAARAMTATVDTYKVVTKGFTWSRR